MKTALVLAIVLALPLAGCGHAGFIKGTKITDTAENRAVLAVVEEVREALRARDAKRLLAVVSTDYYEDMGTSTTDDDYGYPTLSNEIIPTSLKTVSEMHVEFTIHEIEVEEQKARVFLRYNSRARLSLPSGKVWDAHKEFNRVELSREAGGRWLIVSGL